MLHYIILHYIIMLLRYTIITIIIFNKSNKIVELVQYVI